MNFDEMPSPGRASVSVMIFTLNEELHLPLCLKALSWCDDVMVIDSFSTDRTADICREHGARFYQNRFEGFGTQRNWAINHAQPRYKWVLVLDADERVTPELADELTCIANNAPPGVGAYRLRRRFYMWGRWLRYSSLYPTWVVRFINVDRVRYSNRGHAETQTVEGTIADLQHDLIDENLKGIDEWFERQNRYSRKDAEFELATDEKRNAALFASDPLSRRSALKRLASHLPFRGLWYFLYSYIWCRGFLDGRDGYIFCCMRSQYQGQVAIKKYDMMRTKSDRDDH